MNLSKATQLDEAEKLLDQANAILSELWQVEEAAWNERSNAGRKARTRCGLGWPVHSRFTCCQSFPPKQTVNSRQAVNS
jgi:hypothetical protein